MHVAFDEGLLCKDNKIMPRLWQARTIATDAVSRYFFDFRGRENGGSDTLFDIHVFAILLSECCRDVPFCCRESSTWCNFFYLIKIIDMITRNIYNYATCLLKL